MKWDIFEPFLATVRQPDNQQPANYWCLIKINGFWTAVYSIILSVIYLSSSFRIF
jgi:hypothetical protein